MAAILQITEAVVAQLNAAPFSQPFVAVRSYAPSFSTAEMKSLHVTVVPRAAISEPLDRIRDAFRYEIDVAVQQKTDGTAAALDPLMTLVEEIADRFRRRSLPGAAGARCIDVKNAPVFSPEHLDERRLFTSVLTLAFRVVR